MITHVNTDVSMLDLLLAVAETRPDSVVLSDDSVDLTTQTLVARVMAVAAHLEELGVRPGDGVAHLLPNRAESFIVRAAAWAAGAYSVALHATSGDDDITYMVKHSQASVLVLDTTLSVAGRLSELGLRVIEVDGSGAGTLARVMSSRAEVINRSRADQPAQISYTGGTSGRPKGVMLTHRAHAFAAQSLALQLPWPDVPSFLCATPVTHAGGSFVLPSLMRGGRYTIARRFDACELLTAIRDHGYNATFMVPTMIYGVLDELRRSPSDTSRLQLLVYGGAATSPTRMAEATQHFGGRMCQIYGQTEAPLIVASLPDDERLAAPGRDQSCGRATPGVEVAVFDEDGTEQPPGEVGEFCVRGPILMDGYHRAPEETARTLRDGWLHTGDVARIDDDGYIYIVDRIKDMVISGGFNVFMSQVDSAVSAHPAVREACSFGEPDPKWGESVSVAVVLEPGHDATEADIRSWGRDRLGPISAPKRVYLVEEIPVTSMGKHDRRAVRDSATSAALGDREGQDTWATS